MFKTAKRKKLILIIASIIALGFLVLFLKEFLFGGFGLGFQKKQYIFHNNQAGLNPATLESLNLSEKFKSVKDFLGASGKQVFLKKSDDIEKAVVGADSGTLLVLPAGEFEVNLEINSKTLVLVGSGTSTIIKAKEPQKPVIALNQAQAAVQNLVIKDSAVGIEAKEKSKISVSYVKFENISATAYYASDSYAELNYGFIYNSLSAFKAVSSTGFVKNSIIRANGKSGIDLRSSKFEIDGNDVSGNSSYGVSLDQDSEATINGNCIQGNKGYNIRIEKTGDIYK